MGREAFLWVFLGSGLGGVIRFGIGAAILQRGGMPIWGTLAVNLIGSLLIGIVAGWHAQAPMERDPWRIGLAPGFLGGFTTFSAFSLETFELLTDRRFGLAAAYGFGSVAMGVAGAALGYWMARRPGAA